VDKTKLTILVIEDSPEYAELIRHWIEISSGRPALIPNWADTLRAGLHRLAQGDVDIIILDLDLPDSSGFQTFASVQAHARGVPIVILSADDSQALALRAIQEGAEDYLVKSTCGPELLLRTMLNAIVRHATRAANTSTATAPGRATAIGILGAKGGVGATTISCNLAAELRRQTSQKVLLTGLDSRADLAYFLMGLSTKYSLRDAVEALNRLDQTYWEGIVTRGPDDVDFVPATGRLAGEELAVNSIPQLLNQIRPFYQWIVFDLGRPTSRSMSLLYSFDKIFVVTTTALSALYEAKQLIGELKGVQVEERQLGLIINELVQGPSVTDREVRRIFGVRMYARLSSNYPELEKACLQQRLPHENSIVRKQIAALARTVAGLPEPGSPHSWLLSVARKIRRGRVGRARAEAA
jgi:Flp pilus assembly CpaE family ATPase